MTWLTLMPAAGRNSYVVTTGPGWYSAISPSTPNSAHLAAISAARLGEHLAVDRARLLALLQQRDRRQRVAVERERQALLGSGFFFGAGDGRLRPALDRGLVVFRIENLPGPGHLAHDRRRVLGRERNVLERDVILPGLLEVARDTTVRRSRSFVRLSRCRTQPTVSRPIRPGEAHAQLEEDVAERDLGRQGNGEQDHQGDREQHALRSCRSAPGTRRRAPARRCLRSPCPRRRAGAGRTRARGASGPRRRAAPSPAALVPGFGSGRAQNRRQPRTKSRPATAHAARPKRA